MYLKNLPFSELKNLKAQLLPSLHILNNQIIKDINHPKKYNVYKSYKDLIFDVLKDENLLNFIGVKKDILEQITADLEESLKKIILEQEQMKKRRKNIKERERLKRKVNEAREKAKIKENDGSEKQEKNN